MEKLNLDELRKDLSVRGKNGIGFLLSGTLVWLSVTIVYMQSFAIEWKNILLLILTGLMFPAAVGISNMIRADWKMEGNCLSRLGLIFNFAQFIYFPLVYWALLENPEQMVFIFAVITGAHFFPYGWFYQTKAYYVMAPVISVAITVIALATGSERLWMIPLAMVILLIILIAWLHADYKRKA